MQHHTSGNPQFIRNINQSLILNLVREYGTISRNVIAKLTRLSGAAVSNLTKSLIEAGYLQETGEGSSKVGRKPVLMELTEKEHFVIGVDLEGVSRIRVAITDLKANIVCRVEHTLSTNDVSAVIDSIVSSVGELLDNSKIEIKKIVGIGIGSPGTIECSSGKVIHSIHLGWENIHLRALVEQELNVPVVVDTDTNAPALAEFHYGARRGARNLIYIAIGVGVGTGLIIDGKIYRGIDGTAGEFGHTVIDLNGYPCGCGNHGCLETLITESAIIRRATEEIARSGKSLVGDLARGREGKISTDIIYKSSLRGDKFAVDLIKQTGYYLGIGLVNLVNFLNPEVVIIGGDISRLGDILFESAKEVVSHKAISVPARRVEILPSSFGKEVGIIGAATLVLDRSVFHVPEIKLKTGRLRTSFS